MPLTGVELHDVAQLITLLLTHTALNLAACRVPNNGTRTGIRTWKQEHSTGHNLTLLSNISFAEDAFMCDPCSSKFLGALKYQPDGVAVHLVWLYAPPASS